VVARFIFAILIAPFVASAQGDNCERMAEMAKDAANLRNAGVPLTAVEKKLRKDVLKPDELAVALIVVRLVYKTNGTGEQLKREVLKNCK